jgi:peptidoglycan hydrolase-like protein with peptidoglycan-binding domain
MTTTPDSPEISSAPEDKNSVSPTRAKPRAAAPAKPYAVVGGGETDDVLLSRAVPANKLTHKSLTVKHLQRRLAELGYGEAAADRDGYYGVLTEYSVREWQTANGHAEGDLTAAQFSAIFDGDINVTVVIDTPQFD